MADNVEADPGSGGAKFATDECTGPVHYPYVKLADGTADSTAKIAGDATNGLDVDVTRVQGTVTVSGTVNVGTFPDNEPFNMAQYGGSAVGPSNPVDVEIAAADNAIGRVKITDGTNVATVLDYTNSDPLAVRLTDTNGDYVAAGGGTQYAEDTTAAAAEQITMAGVVRKDTAATLVDADGDRTELQVDASGRLHCNVGNTVAVSGTVTANLGTIADVATQTTLNSLNGKVTACDTGAVTISGALPAGSAKIGGVDLDSDVAPGAAIPGTAQFVAGTDGTNARALKTDSGGELQVDVLTLPAIGTGDNTIGRVKLTDGTEVASVDGSNRLEVAVGNTVTVSGTVNIGTFPDNEPINVAQWGGSAPGASNAVHVQPGTGASFPVTDNSGSLTVDQDTAANLNAQVVGAVAHDSAVSGNPVRVAGRATTSEYTKVGDGDVADFAVDAAGRQIVSLASAFDLQTTVRANLTDAVDTQLLALDASYRYAVMAVLVTNASNSVSTKVAIRDGTADVIKGFAYKDGGGFAHNGGGVPLFIGTLNTALKAQCGTTGADVEVVVTVAKVK